MCSRLRYNFFQRLCHKAVYIRHYGGTRELQTPNHSSPQCADITSWFVVTFCAFLSAPGTVGSGSVRPERCEAGPGSAHSRNRWLPGGGAPAALPFEDSVAGWTGPRDPHLCVVPFCLFFLKKENIKLYWPFVSFRKQVLEKLVRWDLQQHFPSLKWGGSSVYWKPFELRWVRKNASKFAPKYVSVGAWAMCPKRPGLIHTLKDGT